MKHSSLLRRMVPVVLAAALWGACLPASARIADERAAASSVWPFAKSGAGTQAISFNRGDFRVDGEERLDAVVLDQLPDPQVGALALGGQLLGEGDLISMSAVDGLRFVPTVGPVPSSAAFSFTPLFADGAMGDAVTVELHLLAAENHAPVAEHLNLSTYKNVAVEGQFSAVDPEGDLVTYRLLQKPARGAITMPEDGGNTFLYTPYENKTGKDSFTYLAIDAVGNASAPATVKIKIEKARTAVSYADLEGHPAHKAAIRLAEEKLLIGECMGGTYFFRPDAPMSRGEFMALAMRTVGMDPLKDVERTGFSDDSQIPGWAKNYATSALRAGLIQGIRQGDGQAAFCSQEPISRAEAAVFLDRALQITDAVTTVTFTDCAAAPAWALQAAANLNSCGLMPVDSAGSLGLERSLTRGEAAQLLCSALDLMESRDDGGWLRW